MSSTITLSPGALGLTESLLANLHEANRLDGYIARQSGAFGAIAEALVKTLACAIMDSQIMHYDDARAMAERVYDETLNNGENVAYTLDLINRGII